MSSTTARFDRCSHGDSADHGCSAGSSDDLRVRCRATYRRCRSAAMGSRRAASDRGQLPGRRKARTVIRSHGNGTMPTAPLSSVRLRSGAPARSTRPIVAPSARASMMSSAGAPGRATTRAAASPAATIDRQTGRARPSTAPSASRRPSAGATTDTAPSVRVGCSRTIEDSASSLAPARTTTVAAVDPSGGRTDRHQRVRVAELGPAKQQELAHVAGAGAGREVPDQLIGLRLQPRDLAPGGERRIVAFGEQLLGGREERGDRLEVDPQPGPGPAWSAARNRAPPAAGSRPERARPAPTAAGYGGRGDVPLRPGPVARPFVGRQRAPRTRLLRRVLRGVDGPAEPVGQPLRLQGPQVVRMLGHPVEQHLTERRRDPALLLDLVPERRAGALGDQPDRRSPDRGAGRG